MLQGKKSENLGSEISWNYLKDTDRLQVQAERVDIM
jgi:hypothetical protein